jgi:hypothetical protein
MDELRESNLRRDGALRAGRCGCERDGRELGQLLGNVAGHELVTDDPDIDRAALSPTR